MNRHATVAARIAGQLDRLKIALARQSFTDIPVTVVCVARHGYATTRVTVESAYSTTRVPFVLFYLDVNSPDVVREYLSQQARARTNFYHLRLDEYVSRQTARLLVLDLVPTRFTVFIDNNMLFAPGWLEYLLEAAAEPADIVSPFIVMQGGRVHFSGSSLKPGPNGTISRRQNTDDCPPASRLQDVRPKKMDIDFGESHCCLLTTDGFRSVVSSVFPEDMHNAHTLGLATYLLKSSYGQRMVIEPRSLVSILPIGFGYDIPWIFESYLNLECLSLAYELYGKLIGKGTSTTIENLWWHRKHLMYLLLTMTERDHLERSTMLESQEIPDTVEGYDRPLPDDGLEKLQRILMPFVEARFPAYGPDLTLWLDQSGPLFTGDVDQARAMLSTMRDVAAIQRRQFPWHP